MKKCFAIALFVCALVTSVLPAIAWEGRVVDVADGDTITVEPAAGGDRTKIRLYGIDCPEMRQPYGQAARRLVFDVALYETVEVDEVPRAKDCYGRTVAVVTLRGVGVLQELLLDAGLAWVYPGHCQKEFCARWTDLMHVALINRTGLWQDENPVPPWKWRKGREMQRRHL